MKRLRDGLVAVIMVVGLMGFIGNDLLTPARCSAEEKGAKKEEKAVKETKATKEDKAVKEEKAGKETKSEKKAAAPAKKKAVKKGPPPMVKAEPKISVLAKSVGIDIMGTGYEPGQEVRILFTDEEGMQTDVGYALEPVPMSNKSGAFFTTWKVDEFIKAGLVKPGAFALTVTNAEFKPLAETYVYFKAAPKVAKKEEKKEEKKDGEKKEKKDGEKKDGEKKEKKEKKSE